MWAQAINMLLGIWLMAAPGALQHFGAPRDNDHIVGPLIATFACIALAGCTRVVRWWNVPLGAWLVAAPWILPYGSIATINDVTVGLLVIALSLVKGQIRHRYGGGWSVLWQKTNPTSSSAEAAA